MTFKKNLPRPTLLPADPDCTPKALSKEERGVLAEIFKRITRTIQPSVWDRSRSSSTWPDSVMTSEDAFFVLGLIEVNALPCVMGTSAYGGLYITVFDHSDAPGVAPGGVFVLFRECWEETAKLPGRSKAIFDKLSRFTHTEDNRRICAFYGFPEPEGWEEYEY